MALKRIAIALAVLLTMMLAGCGAPATESDSGDAGGGQAADTGSGDDPGQAADEQDQEPAEDTDATEQDAQPSLAWTEMPLVDVATGEAFTISDFKGTQVFIQAFAVW